MSRWIAILYLVIFLMFFGDRHYNLMESWLTRGLSSYLEFNTILTLFLNLLGAVSYALCCISVLTLISGRHYLWLSVVGLSIHTLLTLLTPFYNYWLFGFLNFHPSILGYITILFALAFGIFSVIRWPVVITPNKARQNRPAGWTR